MSDSGKEEDIFWLRIQFTGGPVVDQPEDPGVLTQVVIQCMLDTYYMRLSSPRHVTGNTQGPVL